MTQQTDLLTYASTSDEHRNDLQMRRLVWVAIVAGIGCTLAYIRKASRDEPQEWPAYVRNILAPGFCGAFVVAACAALKRNRVTQLLLGIAAAMVMIVAFFYWGQCVVIALGKSWGSPSGWPYPHRWGAWATVANFANFFLVEVGVVLVVLAAIVMRKLRGVGDRVEIDYLIAGIAIFSGVWRLCEMWEWWQWSDLFRWPTSGLTSDIVWAVTRMGTVVSLCCGQLSLIVSVIVFVVTKRKVRWPMKLSAVILFFAFSLYFTQCILPVLLHWDEIPNLSYYPEGGYVIFDYLASFLVQMGIPLMVFVVLGRGHRPGPMLAV